MKVVTAALVIEKGKVLIARRKTGDANGGKWEFPGGKLEENETPQECLRREIKEELGVDSVIGAFFDRSVYDYRSGTIELLAYYAELRSLDFFLTAHEEIRWVEVTKLDEFEFSPADIPFAKRLANSL